MSFDHLGNTTTQIYDILIKMLMPHHGLKVSQKVMLNSLIFGHPGTLRYVGKYDYKMTLVTVIDDITIYLITWH